MRFVVIGAGAVGGAIGARLFESGHQVVLVARGAHLEALQTEGLRFATPERSVVLPVPAVSGPDELALDPQDVLILAVKTQDSAGLLREWGPAPVGDSTAARTLPLVCAQNGVESERLALRVFDRVYGMCVFLPAGHLEPGSLTVPGHPLSGVLTVGRYPSGTDAISAAVTTALSASRFRSTPSEAVIEWKYNKLLANLGNALEGVCGPIEGDAARTLLDRARQEGIQVLTTAKITFTSDQDEQRERKYLTFADIPGHSKTGGSTWQSLTRGTGSVEVDYLSGEIVLLGRLHGVPTPVNRTLQELANESARLGARPGRLTAEQVTLLIDSLP